jgi:hypothetical protein
MSLLKEAISEYDTSDTVDVKGPMLDPILSWDGDGELPTNKDAASILERYYFNESADKGVKTLDEADYENDKGEKGKGMQHTEGPEDEEQAGTSDAGTISGSKEEKKKDIAKEEMDLSEAEDALDEMMDSLEEDGTPFHGGDVKKAIKDKKDYVKEEDDFIEEDEDLLDEDLAMENEVIEKLISEMEEEDDDDDDDSEEEVEELDKSFFKGVSDAPKEKKATSAMQDTHGAGTEQAGTGPDEDQIPPRKDAHDKMVKAKNYSESDEFLDDLVESILDEDEDLLEQDEEEMEGGEEEEKELDVDKEVSEGTPLNVIAQGEEEGSDSDYMEEVFKLFESEIEDEDYLEEWGKGSLADLEAEKKADMIAVQRKCLKYKEIGDMNKYRYCMAKGKEKVNAHFEKMKKKWS